MVLKGLVKLGVAGGAVYWTAQQGVWGDAQNGAEAGKKLANSVYPPANQYLEKLTVSPNMNEAIVKNWNAGVKTVFDGVSKVPELSYKYASMAGEAISDLTK